MLSLVFMTIAFAALCCAAALARHQSQVRMAHTGRRRRG